MNTLIKMALAGAIRSLIGSDNWSTVRGTIAKLESSSATGEEKRALAVTAISEAGWTLAQVLLNVAIEIAVLLLDSTAKRLEAQ